MSVTRIVSIWLPRLSIERWAKIERARRQDEDFIDPEGRRLALTREGAHGLLVHAVTDAAAAAGARPGQRLTDARALDPALEAVPCDHGGDTVLLERLARWATRWSPHVEIDGADALRLDASGVAHLFGGERPLLDDIETRFATLGLTARVAIAPTPGAAWALARYGSPAGDAGRGILDLAPPPRNKLERRSEQGRLAALLAPLPVAALRLPSEVTRTLERLGLKTIGALAGVPRRSLARRFREKDNPLDALDRALGRRAEPLAPARIETPPRALQRFAEPVTDPAAGPQALDLLVPDLARQLERHRLGARRLVLTAYRVDGSLHRLEAATAFPTRDPAHLHRLLAEKAGALDPGFGIDAVALAAEWAEPLDPAQDALDGGPPPAVAIGRLTDRLAARLGAHAVTRPQGHASHKPERASGWRQALADESETEPAPPRALRPERLLDTPEAIAVIYATPEGLPRRFVWRRAVHDIARVEGPERIAPEWWRERSTARLRDYYRVEDRQGRRYWIYRDGLYGDGRGGDPTWYLHGLFG
ncbi:DUF6504 family protein [Sphingomicrobium nitratireducens]|uniref:DUF6504 family protein n=1 Tax=Sphingomicrobium nitratireducens TaxID=2964666 RepID=UPI002240BE3C|nr:DUF6504 family protein [Sphingomicrobium nitratireducens]